MQKLSARFNYFFITKYRQQGFTLLEIALALVILSVVGIYTLDMYQNVSMRKREVDEHVRMEKIVGALRAYFRSQETLPPATTMGSEADILPVTKLSLAQRYRLDSHGRPYRYYPSSTASGYRVDGKEAAGVLISYGENQVWDSLPTDIHSIPSVRDLTTRGDDILMPVEVGAEAVSIVLADLETLGKRVEAYNREYAGIQNNSGTDYYGVTSAGAPPIIDPDNYDQYYSAVNPTPVDTYPQLYPYQPYYPGGGAPPYSSANQLACPTMYDILFEQPDDGWPGAGLYGGIYTTWPARQADPTVPPLHGPGTEPPSDPGSDLPPHFNEVSGVEYWPNIVAPLAYDSRLDRFGVYNPQPLLPPAPTSAAQRRINTTYELTDENGCIPVSGVPPADPNCVQVFLDTSSDPIGLVISRYSLGQRLRSDPWGTDYQWGGGLSRYDPRYHLFFSLGLDRRFGSDLNHDGMVDDFDGDGQPDLGDDIVLY